MSEPPGFDLDGDTDRAWSAFARRLADRLAEMTDGETLTLGLAAPSDESEPSMARVQFVALPDAMVRRTEHAADDDIIRDQVSPQRDADQLAADTLGLLRDDHGVMHPAFLTVAGESYEVEVGRGLSDAGRSSTLEDDPPDQITEALDSAHLAELAFAAITHGIGREPIRDVDGDLIVEFGSTRVFVRALESAPVIQLFSRLVHNIKESRPASAMVAALNKDYPFVKFLFADEAVLACMHVPAVPFVPAQLRHMLAIFSELSDELDDELVRRLGGVREMDRAHGEPEQGVDAPDGVPPELMTLVRLDPDGQGLDPEQTAEICGYDRGLTRQLLHIAVGQEEVWQEAAKESVEDPGEEARCTEEAAGWDATRRSLIGALELIDSLEG